MAKKTEMKKSTVKAISPKAPKKRVKPFWVNFKTGESGRGRYPV